MARDQALLDLAEQDGTATLRLYRWEPHCISFGRNEPATRRYDRNLISNLELDCVRRPTGGRAVWHARELTYSVAAPLELFGSLSAAYQQIHQMLASAIGMLGVSPTLAARPERATGVAAGPCFAGPAGGEVMVGSRKVIGSAQLQQGSAFLQHGSLLLGDDQSIMHQVTRGEVPESRAAPLSTMLARPVEFDEAAGAIERAARSWTSDWSGPEAAGNLESLARLHEDQFRSEQWTWSR